MESEISLLTENYERETLSYHYIRLSDERARIGKNRGHAEKDGLRACC